MKQFPEAGVYFGIPEGIYHAHGWKEGIVSKSMLWHFARNPYRWRYGVEKVSPAWSWGSTVDVLLFTPEEVWNLIAVHDYDSFRTKDAQEWKKEQEKYGRSVMSRDEMALAEQAVDGLRRHPKAAALLEGAGYQVSAVVDLEDRATGQALRAKARLDVLPAASQRLADLKTCAPMFMTSRRKLAGHFGDLGYHVQAAMYLDVWNAASGEEREDFDFIVQSNEQPFEVAVLSMDRDAILAGRKWYREAMGLFAQCVAKNEWPNPWDTVETIGVPDWAMNLETEAR